ncbi:MAG: hypothetical protein ACRBEE_07790 [Arenicella sp.]
MSKIVENHHEINQGVSKHPELPVIDWSQVGAEKPTHVTVDDPSSIPAADIAIITWTSDEWSAFDHVFINSDTERGRYAKSWRDYWHPYPSAKPILYFQLVTVKKSDNSDINVLLVKSEVHLAHAPWRSGLQDMVKELLQSSGAKTVLSTGTAGAAQDDQKLGDVVLTTSAKIWLKKSENLPCDYNNNSFEGCQRFTSTPLLQDVQQHLMMPLSNVWNKSVIDELLLKLNSESKSEVMSYQYTYNDLVNSALDPENLTSNQVQILNDVPLLTTDFYYTTDTAHPLDYSFLEMDDAVIAHQASAMDRDVNYAFIRNISDPVVVAKDAQGNPVPESVQGNWSGMIYSYSGFYTSFNSALTAWATITQLV